MENILQEIHGCRKCLDAGYESVQPPPIFEGSLDAPVLIIGQAPGIEELNQKQLFVGSSGKRLFSWLKQAGLKEAWIREHSLIFQRYLCYPGKQPDGSGDRSPSSKQLDLCLHIPVKESTDSENSRPLRRVNKTGQMIIHYVDDMALSARSFLCDSPCISMR